MTSSAARDEQCRYRTRPLTMQDLESAELTNMEVDVVVGRTCRVPVQARGSWQLACFRMQASGSLGHAHAHCTAGHTHVQQYSLSQDSINTGSSVDVCRMLPEARELQHCPGGFVMFGVRSRRVRS